MMPFTEKSVPTKTVMRADGGGTIKTERQTKGPVAKREKPEKRTQMLRKRPSFLRV